MLNDPVLGWGSTRRFAQMVIVLFGASAAFPLTAAVLQLHDPPLLVGVADVTFALLLVMTAIGLQIRVGDSRASRHHARAYRVSRAGSGLVLLFLSIFFLARDTVRWDVLVPGLAWRGWLLLQVLPSLLVGLAAEQPEGSAATR